jgi:hypothetical protein
MSVYFRDRIRDERKFQCVDELVRQIAKDVEFARGARTAARKDPGWDAGGRRPEAGKG